MIFAGLKLPRRLQRHVANLSSTVQVLLSELILYAEGFEAEANHSTGAELACVLKTKKYNALLAEQLRELLKETRADDAAIAAAAAAGRSTREIAEFLGMEQNYVMRRLRVVRNLAAALPMEKSADESAPGAEVIEIFALEQRRFHGASDEETEPSGRKKRLKAE